MNPPSVSRLANRNIFSRTLLSPRPNVSRQSLRHVSEKRRLGQFDNVDWEATNTMRKLYPNPLDYVQNHRRELAKRQYHMRRIRIAGAGVVFCVLAQVVIVALFPAEDAETVEADESLSGELAGGSSGGLRLGRGDHALAPDHINKEWEGKPVRVIEGGPSFAAKDDGGGGDVEMVETGTSTVPRFPKTIYLPTGSDYREEEYTLLGLGIRTVSFLGIQVYVVGLYIATSSLPGLQADLVKAVNPIASALIPGEKEQLRSGLLDGEKSYQIWDTLLKEKGSDVKSAWRIVPVRNTDFAHLKDGWVRGITSKTQAASISKEKEQFADESFGLAMRDFKALFGGKGRAPKGSAVLLTRDGDGKLGVLFQEKEGQGQTIDFGVIPDERISRLIWLGYLGGKSVSSEAARNGIVDGIMELVERPIGSIETRVS